MNRSTTAWKTIDWVIVLGFFLLALKFQLSFLYAAEFTVIPNADSGTVASFIAGWQNDDRFIGDMALDDKTKFAIYISLVLPAVAMIDWLVDDLGLAFLVLMLPIVFSHACGFYLVGRRVLDGRLAAALFALATLVPVWTMDGDLWGIYHTPLVRMAFGALFPFLLLAAFNVQNNLSKLYVLAAFCGIALYVHGVSGPSVTCALFLGTLAFIPNKAQFITWARKCLVAALIFVVLITPFAVIYVSSFPSLERVPQGGIDEILALYGPYTDISWAMESLLNPKCCNAVRGHGWHWVVWIGGLIGLIIGSITHKERRSLYGFCLLFIIGILITSIGITAIDQWISNQLDRAPAQVDLIRNMRYLVPILILGYGVLFQQAIATIKAGLDEDRRYRMLIPGLNVAFLIHIYTFVVPQFNSTSPGYLSTSFNAGEAMIARYTPNGTQDLLRYLKAQEPNTSVFSVADEVMTLAIRYQSLQPVTYIYKDRNVLLYSNHEDTGRFLSIRDQYDAFLEVDNDQHATRALCEALRLAPSELLVIDHRIISAQRLNLARQTGKILETFDEISVIDVQPNNCHQAS